MLDQELKDDDELEGDLDEILTPGTKKPKKDLDDDSLDTLAEEEESVLPEDAFDDTEPDQDLW